MMLPALRRIGFPIGRIRLPKRGDVRVKRVLMLMLPVSVGLGLININLLLNSTIGSIVSDAGAARRSTPRSASTCSRRACSASRWRRCSSRSSRRLAARKRLRRACRRTIGVGLRQIALLLIPAGAAMLVLGEPMVRLVFQRGEFDAESTQLTAEALFWFSFSLPVQRLRPDAHPRVLRAPAPVDRRRRSRSARWRSTRSAPTCWPARWGSAASCSARRSPTSRW